MNIKENILFLRNEWTATGEVDKTDRTDLGKCIHLYDETQGNKETQALSTEKFLRQVQENRQIIIKEEGSKEEDRHEADVKKFKKNVKNVYVDLKRRHQNDENWEDF